MKKVAILGATGLVGQRFIQLLENHPYFQISTLAASQNSAGKTYKEAVTWRLNTPMPDSISDMQIEECKPTFQCDYVFSALPSSVAGPIEDMFVNAGYTVFSNAACHRMDSNVPLVVPEVNWQHLSLAHSQTTPGVIITNPNCSTVGLVMALKTVADLFGLEEVNVVTMQALSGAGYPGVASLDIVDNDTFQPLKSFNLPSAPEKPLIYLHQSDAPQPRVHRNLGGGMTVSVGQLVQYSERSLRFLALVHNTIRGAAGCAILNAEMYEATCN